MTWSDTKGGGVIAIGSGLRSFLIGCWTMVGDEVQGVRKLVHGLDWLDGNHNYCAVGS